MKRTRLQSGIKPKSRRAGSLLGRVLDTMDNVEQKQVSYSKKSADSIWRSLSDGHCFRRQRASSIETESVYWDLREEQSKEIYRAPRSIGSLIDTALTSEPFSGRANPDTKALVPSIAKHLSSSAVPEGFVMCSLIRATTYGYQRCAAWVSSAPIETRSSATFIQRKTQINHFWISARVPVYQHRYETSSSGFETVPYKSKAPRLIGFTDNGARFWSEERIIEQLTRASWEQALKEARKKSKANGERIRARQHEIVETGTQARARKERSSCQSACKIPEQSAAGKKQKSFSVRCSSVYIKRHKAERALQRLLKYKAKSKSA